MNKSVSVYGSDDVQQLLDYDGCIRVVREAMACFTRDGIPQPLRNIFEIGPDRFFGTMPGMLAAPQGFGAKLLSVFEDPKCPGRAPHRGVVVLFNREDGELVCIADASEITKIRTAAASAVATDTLARPDAARLAIFGCGAQAASHVRAITRIRNIKEVLIWGRSIATASQFADRIGEETGLVVRAVHSPVEAAATADIVCTVTASPTPVLLGEWVRPGTHVNVVGSSRRGPVEVDHELVIKSRYIADSRLSALSAASEFLSARDSGLVRDDHIVAEIGEVLLGRVPGRTSKEEITLYKSLGHIVQDLAASAYIHERASRKQPAEP